MNLPLKAGMSPTAQLSARICKITFNTLDQATVAAVKRLIADGVAVALAGSREAPAGLVAEYVREMGGGPHASVWGFGFRTSPLFAAYANAVSMHVLDFEPMSSPPTHAVSPTVPVALALAEARGANGREIIAACAKGFEMQGRVLLASSHARGSLPFHTPSVVGALGSAVTASHLLRLDPPQLANALGMAASRCGGLPANTGSMVKCTHCGNAAAAGLEATLLAQRGFSAHPGILEAPQGYVETFFPAHFDYGALLKFGQPYRCVDPGMAIKFYPSKYPTHFAITAALRLRGNVGDPAGIAQVRILTPEIEDADRPRPRSGLEGKFSFQYTTAVALLDGRVGIESFTDERRFRRDMVDLLDKISVVRDPTLSRDTRNMRVEVEVTLNDGTRHRQACGRPPGFWGEPLDPKQHRAKVRDCLSVRLLEPHLGHTLELLENLERLSAQETEELTALLA
ncbi:MAG: MmgE/PrpD family protein [Betaproteobacteria bacterium]|nr:MmgE/PrpD family protein [Betaproteobacteria bacterium]